MDLKDYRHQLVESVLEGSAITKKIDSYLRVSPLTKIESHVCLLLYLGKTAKEMASIRNCSYRTIERHVANIKIKIRGEKLSPAVLSAIQELGL
jgi:DNA-binding CsgD family transcriptional regulator